MFTLQAFGATYNSFTYDLENNAVAAPEAAEFYINITGSSLGISSLKEPVDVCNDLNGNIYIVDKENNRLVKTDQYGKLISVLDSFVNNGVKDTFKNPEGVCVTNSGDIYICDTENSRIVQLDSNFYFIRIISSPKSAVLGSSFIFTPTRIAVDSLGRIYVVSKNFNSGIVELDKNGEFNQIFGSVKVEFTPIELLWKNLSTKAQRERSEAFVPNEYSSVNMDKDDFVYACSAYYDSSSGNSSGSVKKLNSIGDNILKDVPDESINKYSKGTYAGPETYVDICSMESGIYALLDNTRGRVFVYNDNADLLFEFGAKGDYNGTFGTVSAITYSNNRFYIADSKNDFVSVFSLTEYGSNFLKAAALHKAGDYQSENAVWRGIYAANNNNICTIRNFGRVYYREGNYIEAMRYFKLANDRSSYSEAFAAQRKIFINDNFTFIFIGCIVLCVLLAVLHFVRKRMPKKEKSKFSYSATLKFSTKVIFRPISGFWDMKRERYGSTAAAVTILVAVTLLYALQTCLQGFIFSSGVTGKSFFLSMLTILVPFFLFVICNWCVSNLMNGEGNFKYIFMGTAYSLTPMMIILPVLFVLSHIFSEEEKGIYFLLMFIMFFWTFILIVCSNMEVHAYSMSKTILVLFISVLIMVIVVFLAALVFALMQQIIGVASDMINEINLRN